MVKQSINKRQKLHDIRYNSTDSCIIFILFLSVIILSLYCFYVNGYILHVIFLFVILVFYYAYKSDNS